MADTIEKIYCTDGRDNDLAAILATTKNNDPATMMAAMGGGMNNWMNNPFVYLVWMIHNETSGDMAYTANMAYADFYPTVLDTVDKCITYAKLVASDPDGYGGMEFMRWTSDATGKSLTLNWEDFI